MLSKIRNFSNYPPSTRRLCGKIQGYTGTANTYAYSPSAKPHAVRRYYNGLTNELYNLRWDNNGNLAQQTVYSVNNNTTNYQTMRMLFWDEDDRLNLVAGDGYLSYYAYGHDGNRAVKMTGNAAIDQTGTLLNSTNLENITIYPNEYLTVTQAEYTKYYYAGGNRIASKIGTGGFGKMQRLCTQDLNLTANANTLFGNALQQIVNITNQPNDEFPVNVCGGYSVATELLADPLPNFYINSLNLNFTQNNLLQQFRQNLTGGAEPVYYFHSDHLGSASWITNGTGAAVQHLQYLPFGEPFVNEQSTGYFERFTFTGKERDAETGYYYHGARFNSSDIGWLSVDPMADKYPSMTPYNYCAWNPIKLVDPSGETIWIVGDDGVPVKYLYGEKYMGTDIFVKQTFEAINSIHEDDPDNSGLKLSKLEDNTLNSDIYVIKTQEESNYFNLLSSASSENYLKAIIEFNPELGLYSQISNKTTAKVMSPSSALFHEFGHAYDYFIKDENGKTYVDRHNNENNIYKNDEEKYNIINNEYVLAKKRNELIRGSYNNGVRAAIIDISTDNGGMRSTKVKKKLSAYKR